MKPETRLKKKDALYKEIDAWLESNDNNFPSEHIIVDGKEIPKSQMTENQKKQVELAKKFKIYFNEDIDMFNKFLVQKNQNVPEKYRRIVAALRSKKPKEFKEKDKEKIKKERAEERLIMRVVTWFKLNPGRLPKNVSRPKSPEEKAEASAYRATRAPFLVEAVAKYEYTKILDIPQKYREYMKLYRAVPQDERMFEMYVDFLKKNQRTPRSAIVKDNKRLGWKELKDDELEEVKLYHAWIDSKERAIVQRFSEVPLEKIPAKYKKYISIIRAFTEPVKIDNCFEEFLAWLESHYDKLPRYSCEIRNAKSLEDKKYEDALRKAWDTSLEKKVLNEFIGVPIEEVPEEYRKNIAILRSSWLGITDKDKEKMLLDFLKKSNGKLPRNDFRKDGKILKIENLTINQYRETRLRNFWNGSRLKEMLDNYINIPIEEVPEEYRENIQILRDYGLETKRKVYGDILEEIIEWLKTHKGVFPNSFFPRDPNTKRGTRNVPLKPYRELTDKEKAEVSLANRWYNSKERGLVIKYKGIPLEEIPEEDRDVVQKIRENAVRQPGTFKKRDSFKLEDYVSWLETHNDQKPRGKFYSKGITKKVEKLTPDELYERDLYLGWQSSEERKLFIQYTNVPLDQIPEEHREKIGILRLHGVKIRISDKSLQKVLRKAVGNQVGSNKEVRVELLGERAVEEKIPE